MSAEIMRRVLEAHRCVVQRALGGADLGMRFGRQRDAGAQHEAEGRGDSDGARAGHSSLFSIKKMRRAIGRRPDRSADQRR
jgi:hypothetical protein